MTPELLAVCAGGVALAGLILTRANNDTVSPFDFRRAAPDALRLCSGQAQTQRPPVRAERSGAKSKQGCQLTAGMTRAEQQGYSPT